MLEMIGIEYVIGFSMAITNVVKKRIPASLVPFLAIALAIALNLVNALLFGGSLLGAGRTAFIATGVVVGMFSAGSAVRKKVVPDTTIANEQV